MNRDNPYAFLEPVPDWLREAYANDPLVHSDVRLSIHQGWTREKFFEELARVSVEKNLQLHKLLVEKALREFPRPTVV